MRDEHLNIQWYPGHMTKTRRQIEADLKLVDAVCEIVDARIPISSRNPDIDAMCGNKPRIIVLNRMDLADPEATKRWAAYFRGKGMAVVVTDCKSRKGISDFQPAVQSVLKEKIERNMAKGMNKPLKIMIVGIPNVGKSTFINGFAGQQRAKAADKPGVTRGKQWITVDNFELLDMPGVLWRKFENNNVASNLAFIGSIKDDILDIETLAMSLIDQLKNIYPEMLKDRYKLKASDLEMDNYDILRKIARKRGMLLPGNEENTERAAIMLCDEFRASKLGRISLERPEDYV